MNEFLSYQSKSINAAKHYTIPEISLVIHIFSSVLRFLCLSDLKKEGVKPVIFLNW